MTMYECPLCGRAGFTRVGLTRHYCPGTEVAEAAAENWSPLRRLRRLTAAEIAKARLVADVPPTWGPYRINDSGWYVLEGWMPDSGGKMPPSTAAGTAASTEGGAP